MIVMADSNVRDEARKIITGQGGEGQRWVDGWFGGGADKEDTWMKTEVYVDG